MTRPAVGVKTQIEQEKGRWVVYMDLSFWREDAPDNPLEIVRRRISDYGTRREAEVAAHWMERTADRTKPFQNLGF
jgi:hypothetical protein